MLLNYVKLAVRLLIRNPFFGIINVAGLAIGFAVFFVLWPFTVSEFRSDKFIKDHDRISRILFDWNWSEDKGKSWGHLIIAGQLGHISSELHQQDLIEDFTRLTAQEHFYEYSSPGLRANLVLSVDRDHENLYTAKEEKAICADKNIFEFFGLEFVAGDRTTALEKAGSVAISEQNALRIFGQLPAIGQWIKVNGLDFTVTGIFRDLPSNSHLQFDMVFSNATRLAVWNQPDRNVPWTRHYCKLKRADDDLTAILTKNFDHLMGWYMKENPHLKINFLSQPLSEIVFSENYNADTFQNKSRFSLKVLATVSIAVLLMAWMNYVNLTISQTKARFKEIAARKVSGALTKDLFLQFIAQAAVVNLVAAALGTTLIQLVRIPFFELFQVRVVPFDKLDRDTV
ncbi:MAG TPA: ABC transporter permease, partial [Chryseolinea sp.]